MVSVEKEIQLQENGLRVRAQYVSEAIRELENKRAELAQQETKVTQLELKLAELEKVKEAEVAKFEAARESVEKVIREEEQKKYV